MYTCTSCGENHEEMPAIGFTAPDPYNQLSEEERIAYQAECDSDFCIIRYPDQTDRFIRAVLPIPIIGHQETLEYGVWVSVSEKSFNDYQSHFHDNPENVVYFGMICNRCPLMKPTPSVCIVMSLPNPMVNALCCNFIKAADIRWYATFITA